jgi:hypothetical protein
MRRLWLLRYGRPFILVVVIATLSFLQGVQTLAMHINMFGFNRPPFEIFISFAAAPYVLFAMAATFTALTPLGHEAIDWISQRTSGRSIGLLVRIPLVALLVAPSFFRPDHQYQLASRAAARSSSPAASGRIIGAILGATYFLPLTVVFGFSAIISEDHFLAAAGAALFALLLSTSLALAIIATFYPDPKSAENSVSVESSHHDLALPKAHSLPSIIFWTALALMAAIFTALPYHLPPPFPCHRS